MPRLPPGPALLLLAAALAPCSAVVRDDHYYQDLCFRLSGASVCWPCPEARRNATVAGDFQPSNIIVTRFQAWRDQFFTVTPKLRPGVPFTVGKFDILQRCFPCLTPFPGLDAHRGPDPVIHNAVDLFADCRDLLWVLDVGVVNTLGRPVVEAPPKVVAFDPVTGRVVHSLDLSSLTRAASRLQYLLVDYSLQTGYPWVYISDADARTVIVYDVYRGRGHRVQLPEVVQGDGIRDVLYMGLVYRMDRPSRVYFTYLSSNKLFSIKSVDLRYSRNNGTVVDEGTKPYKMALLGVADTNIFFRPRGKPDVLMWNVDSTFKEANLIPVQTGDDSRLATQVMQGYLGMLWVLESNFQDYVRGEAGCLGASVVLHPAARP